MIVSGDPNSKIGEAIAESFRRASQKAKERDKKRFAENKEVWDKCAKCGTELHITDESYDYNGKTYCAKCKPKRAKRMIPVPGVFKFTDAMHELNGIVKEKKQQKRGGRKNE